MMPSKISKAQIIITELFLTHSFFVGEGYSRIFEISHHDSWISMILGLLIGIIIVYIFHLVSKNINYDLKGFFNKRKILKIIYYPLIILYYSILYIYPIIMIESLVNSYYLTYTNIYFILIPLLLLVLYMSLKGKENIIKTVQFIFPFLIPIIILEYLGLSTLIKPHNFLPILVNTPKDLFTSSWLFAIFSTSPYFLLIEENQDLKTKLFGYIIGSSLVIVLTTLVTGVLGNFYMQLYSFPVYMAYKKINIYSFLQNLENILYLPGYFHAITLCSLSLTKLKELKSQQNKIIPIVISIMGLILITQIFSKDYAKYILLSKIVPFIMLGFIITLGPILYMFSKKKKTRSI